jgi:hypothetical protein
VIANNLFHCERNFQMTSDPIQFICSENAERLLNKALESFGNVKETSEKILGKLWEHNRAITP